MTGFKEINLNSTHDLRTIGVLGNEALPIGSNSQAKAENLAANRTLVGVLSTAANLNLKASQIYPSTLTHYAFAVTNPAGQLTIMGNNSDVTPLSAAGQLTLNAATINQNGVLKAPLGTIELNATSALSFGKDSVTSVSANGQTIPFGAIVNNVWQYPLAGNINLVFNKSLLNPNTQANEYLSLGEKHLIFQSPDIQFKAGSIVDVSGGGELLATQFQPGLGGSNDYLDPNSSTYQGGFAILPTLGSALAPFDPNLSANFSYGSRASIHLSGSSALAAGDYVILPAYYALLPGAYLITPQVKTQDQILTSYTKSGLPIVSGYQMEAGTDIRDSRTSGFLIETSAQVQKHSTYDIQSANSFFAQQALSTNTSVPVLPQDSGQISIDANTKLVLDGQFKVAAPNGRGAKLDISSQNIQVVSSLSSTTTPGKLELLDQSLSKLNVDSLFLGGKRQSDRLTGNTDLTVTADNVTFNQDTKVQALDLIVAAKNKVEVMNGATITSAGKVNTGDHTLVIESREIGVKNSEKLISDVVIPDKVVVSRELFVKSTEKLITDIIKLDKVVVQRGNETISVKNSDILLSDIVISDEVVVSRDVIVKNSEKRATDSVYSDQVVVLSSDAALLRISSDNQVAINRANLRGVEGDLSIATGSKLTSTKSMLLDGSKSTVLDGDIAMQGGALTLSANTINFGEIIGAHPNDLNLTIQKLPSLSVDDLVLNSRGSINFYGNVGQLDSNRHLAPIHFNNLVLDAGALSGFDNSGKTAQLQANNLTLQNSRSVTAAQTGSGNGTLDLNAIHYSQSGSLNVDGFNMINIIVDKQFIATGNSEMKLASDLNLTAGSFTTKGGHSLSLDASSGVGHDVVISGNADTSQYSSSDFGGSISVAANTINLNSAKVLLPSGTLKLQAQTGDILVNGKTDINLAGQAVNFADTLDYTPGGTFSAVADHGKVLLDAESNLDISMGGGSAAGGNLILKTPNSTIELAGKIKATGASANLDVSRFAATQGFDSLMTKLNIAGVTNSLYVRTRNSSIDGGDIIQTVGNVLTANNLNLVADKGAIDIFGTLNANGSKNGGEINLFAGDKITLERAALITAKGTDKGGKVSLSSIDSLLADHSGIEIKTDSKIDVRGTVGGVVTLSALRNSTDINIKPIFGTVTGYSKFYAQGLLKYTNADLSVPGEINSTDIDKINGETIAYMDAAAQNVDIRLGSGIRLRPGVEIDSTGNLTLASAWDFSSQRFGQNLDIPGALIIRSNGRLAIDNSLTDGFQGDASQGAPLQNSDSWSFQLVAGADQASADKFSTIDLASSEKLANSTVKDLAIGTGVSVHTGTGDIKLASGGNFVLTDQTSTVYNAGLQTKTDPYGTLDYRQVDNGIYLAQLSDQNTGIVGEFPVEGGNLVIHAGGDIKGHVSNQFIGAGDPTIGSWLMKQSNSEFSVYRSLTAWGVNSSLFQQNIGSFGGGKVDIAASGNITDLSVMMPTTGKQLGTNLDNNALDIQGGGTMLIKAGGNISGGAYYLGKGIGVITAEGQITGSSSTDLNAFSAGPQIVMSGDQSDPIGGDTNLSLNAGAGIKISAVSDAMVLNNLEFNLPAPTFFTYTDKSKLGLRSLSGDINLNSDTKVITDILKITNAFSKILSTIYPASVDVTTFGGNVKLDHDIALYPSVVSNLNVLAKDGITSSGAGLYSIMMSDADPKLLPNAYLTINTDGAQKIGGELLKDTANKFYSNQIINNTHALNPIHSLDMQPARIVSQTGDIKSVQVILPKQSIIQAGRDLINSPLQLQQINQNDSSIISANRDIIFATSLDINGTPANNSLYQITISGPGNALVKTGRNLDLGLSNGLTTIGNSINPALPIAGANLDVLVGLHEGTPSYNAFIDKYLQTNPLYAEQLIKIKAVITPFMNQLMGNVLTDADALIAFGKLSGDQTLAIQPKLNAILNGVFFNELKIAGSGSAANKSAGNQGGFTAIDTLFPGNQWQGDLSLFFSKLQTINGGDINLLVPGGQVNAGLAVAPSGAGAKSASELGIVAQRQGNINAFVGGKDINGIGNNFTVNTSRVFTLGGGDILIWSSEGNIDAGKGAKSALSVTMDPPFYDANDKLVYPVPKITSGSGIRTAASLGVPAGNVFLFAPKGVVDAGEAGIGGSNVTISATAVLGANNIQVSGTSTGVPVASVGSVAAGLTGTSNVTANASQTAQAAMGADEKDKVDNKNMTLGMLSVELLGFGE
ncbi:MAG: filamentous hemagglutinin family protein [Methylobacter sp.]|nr:filamentous hemagglutinin family protein [Methylobacter sp.]